MDLIGILSLCLIGGVLFAGMLFLYAVIRLNGAISRMEEDEHDEQS